MNYAVITDSIITNVIVADRAFAERIGAVYYGDLPIGIGDGYADGMFNKTVTKYDENGEPIGTRIEHYPVPAYPDDRTPAQRREAAYETMAIVPWDGTRITVDAANAVWAQYAAEGSATAAEISALIADAKEQIREMYPDATEA